MSPGVVVRASWGDSYAQALVSDDVLLSAREPWGVLAITAARVQHFLEVEAGIDPQRLSWHLGAFTPSGRTIFGPALIPYGFGVPGFDPVLEALQAHVPTTPTTTKENLSP